jgi:hypothetical protein
MFSVQSEKAEQAKSHLGHQRGSRRILRLFPNLLPLSLSGWKRVARLQETPVKIQVSLGHPFLMFLYSLSLLAIGAAIGIRFGATWGALRIAVVGAILMVVHDMLVAIVWFFKAARLILTSQRDLRSSPMGSTGCGKRP